MIHGSRAVSCASLLCLFAGLAACDEAKPPAQEAAKEPAPAASATAAAATAAHTASAVAEAPAPSGAPSAEPEAPAASAAAATAPAAPGATATQAKLAASAAPEAKASASAAPAVAAQPTGPVVGKPWQLSTAVQADPGYKCNDEYPHKFTTSGGTNVSYPDPKPRGACAGKGVAVTIPFIPTAAGPGTIKGTFSYGICDEKKTSCLMKKQEISLPFVATAD